MAKDKDEDCDCRWGAKDVALIITTLGSLFLSAWNNVKLHTVDDRQTQQVEKAAEVKATLDVKNVVQEKKLEKIEDLLYVPPDKRAAIPKSEKTGKEP